MCGIAGFYWNSGEHDKKGTLLAQLLSRLYHRGPDEEGKFIDGALYLGMRRLSIQDLTSGKQPFYNEKKNLVVFFNGEIYNYPSLRKSLLSRHQLLTNCDTEIIPHLFEEEGLNYPQKLNGMFAIALYDRNKKKLYLTRDRFGIKPLYYFFDKEKERFAFSSELKALKVLPFFPKKISLKALFYYLYLGFIPSPFTIWEGVYKLLPGMTLEFDIEKFSLSFYRYYHLEEKRILNKGRKSEKNLLRKLEVHLEEAIYSRLLSDVPLGVFLSGGIDSSSIVALLSKRLSGKEINTFSVSFKGHGSYDESLYALMVAKKFKTNHRELELEMNYEKMLEKFFYSYDEPFADSSALPTMAISEAASKEIKVVLSGTGGDEIFLGYRRHLLFKKRGLFRALQYFSDLFFSTGGAKIRKFLGDKTFLSNYYSYFFRLHLFSSPNQFKFFLDNFSLIRWEEVKELFPLDFVLPSFYFHYPHSFFPTQFDFSYYLEGDLLVKEDRATMAFSLEGRVPFLDHNLVEYVLGIPVNLRLKGGLKYLLKKMMKKYLPTSILKRPKQGFAVPLERVLEEKISSSVINKLKKREGLIINDLIDFSKWNSWLEKISKIDSKLANHHLWRMVVLEKWLENNLL